MIKHLIVADETEQVLLYVLAPSIRPGTLWVDMDDTTEFTPNLGYVSMDMNRAGATALRDFLTEWLDSLDATG